MIKSINQNHQSLVNRSIKWLQKYSKFLDCVDEIATQITEMNFGADTWIEEYGHGVWEEINNTLNEWNI